MPNINYIKKLANGSEDFQLKMIDILKKEFPKEKALFLEYCEMQDLLRAANVVHKIKHKFSMLDMKDAYN